LAGLINKIFYNSVGGLFLYIRGDYQSVSIMNRVL